MAAASDKARYYLEGVVPELLECEKKNIFSKEEIAAIIKRRSDFEHKINARGSLPADYARYAEYEMNLDTLKKRRVKRLGVKATGYAGQRRIYFILDRATRKFPGDISLWMQYIEYARRNKAFKKLSRIFMDVLRLHPTDVNVWIYAAQYALETQADMTLARSYMQRGLRFCGKSKSLWLEYAKLELIYVTRIATRQRILGLGGTSKDADRGDPTPDSDQNMIALPRLTGEDIYPTLEKEDEVDETALENLNSTPALTGAIPMAIFDAAMKQFGDDNTLGRKFYDMALRFEELSCLGSILSHFVDSMRSSHPSSPHTQICYIRLPIVGTKATSAQFPRAFAVSLSHLKECMGNVSDNHTLAKEVVEWLQPLPELPGLDPALTKAIQATLKNVKQNHGLVYEN